MIMYVPTGVTVTIRQELVTRLRVFWRAYRRKPECYNAMLGIGRIRKQDDRPFEGFSVRLDRITIPEYEATT